MSNKLFQGVIYQMHYAINRVIGVIDESAMTVACSELSKVGIQHKMIELKDSNSKDIFIHDGYTYQIFTSNHYKDYAIFVEGVDEVAAKYAQILSISLSTIKQYYDTKYDRNHFIKNIVLENILMSDIFLKSRDLCFNMDVNRVVFVIKILSINDISSYDVLQNLFPDRQKDFLFNINETDVVLIKEVPEQIDRVHLEKLAYSIVDTLSSEFYTRAVIGIGAIVQDIKDLARSFKEAQIALDVGKVFDHEQSIMSYQHLGIARLIYQLPITMCETFLKEVFKKDPLESLDQETLFTIHRFFENNLNISETSRKLFLHRNTLVYRIEKIKKITGLDLREFDDAIIFKIALMVKKYLHSNPTIKQLN